MPDGSRPPGVKSYAGERFAPVKGAGGRFIRRADKGKPFATGLKATNPVEASGAAAECVEAESRARQAQTEAEAWRRREAMSDAIADAARAASAFVNYRKECRKGRRAPIDNLLERAHRLRLDRALDECERLLAEGRASKAAWNSEGCATISLPLSP
jgi:hypothetical protein